MVSLGTPLQFTPHPLVRGGDLQTVVGYYMPAHSRLRSPRLHTVSCADGDALVICENAGMRKAPFKKILLMMHGLGGHADSPYMLRIATIFVERGWTVFRMNHRGSGAGRGKARNTYHSGKSEDISRVLAEIVNLYPETPIVATGFSLSGNAVLKLLGEGKDPVPTNLRGAVAVSAPIDLSSCARTMESPRCRLYDRRFVRLLKEAIVERRADFRDFPEFNLPGISSVRDFDEVCTAPLHGFSDAEDYYAQSSARQFLEKITTPAALIASRDDPFMARGTYEALPENRLLAYQIECSGGHMGFVSARKTPLGTRRWLDYAVLTYAEGFLKSEPARAYLRS